jgi:hypothetical protein
VYQIGDIIASGHSLPEKVFKAPSCVVRRTRGSSGSELVGYEEVAEVGFFAVRYPLCLRFTAAIMSGRIIVQTIQTAVNVRLTVHTRFGSRDRTFKL